MPLISVQARIQYENFVFHAITVSLFYIEYSMGVKMGIQGSGLSFSLLAWSSR